MYSDKTKDYRDVWHVDYFYERALNPNLPNQNYIPIWMAEIELETEDQFFAKPPWIGEEVTFEKGFSNAAFVRDGFPDRFFT